MSSIGWNWTIKFVLCDDYIMYVFLLYILCCYYVLIVYLMFYIFVLYIRKNFVYYFIVLLSNFYYYIICVSLCVIIIGMYHKDEHLKSLRYICFVSVWFRPEWPEIIVFILYFVCYIFVYVYDVWMHASWNYWRGFVALREFVFFFYSVYMCVCCVLYFMFCIVLCILHLGWGYYMCVVCVYLSIMSRPFQISPLFSIS